MIMDENEYLMISGLQHFVFCRRQWALIHIEDQWLENEKTVDGELMHRVAHDEKRSEKRGDTVITRGMKIVSHKHRITGVCDVVEFHRSEDGISIFSWEGLWKPYPVEYKRGKPKTHNADRQQLCAQAICLEEMLCCHIPEGSLYYGEPHRREEVVFSSELRQETIEMLMEMHRLYDRQWTPRVKKKKGCSQCSLADICLPDLEKTVDVDVYLDQALKGDG